MDRMTVFKSYKTHPWLSKVYAKLRLDDMNAIESFIASNSLLDKGSFELKVNRMFLDKPKPKRFKEILELLTCCNSAIK